MNRSVILKIVAALAILSAVAIALHSLFPVLLGSRTTITKFADNSDGSLASYYQQGQNLSPRGNTQTTSVTFLAVGDIMLSRNVAGEIQKYPMPLHGMGSMDLPFQEMAGVLKSTDFNFANLESPFDPNLKGTSGGHSLIFSAPSEYVGNFISGNYNFKILNLANNHAFDLGLKGLNFTRDLLDQNGIAHEGTGNNLDQAWQPAVVQARGLRICFIGASFSSINDGGKVTNNYVARIEDTAHLQSAITAAKSECDFVVVTMHAGTEYTRTPNQAQITFAHAAINDGADIVIGAHPHWVQTIEKYQGKYIFYSLGNFIFDQNFSQDTMEGLTLKITISKVDCHPGTPSASEGYPGSSNAQELDSGSRVHSAGMTGNSACADNLQGSRTPAQLDSIKLIPVIITNSQPRPATADESKKILQKIGKTENILTP